MKSKIVSYRGKPMIRVENGTVAILPDVTPQELADAFAGAQEIINALQDNQRTSHDMWRDFDESLRDARSTFSSITNYFRRS